MIDLLGMRDDDDLRRSHAAWVSEALHTEALARSQQWSTSLAVGSSAFVDEVKARLGVRAAGRRVEELGEVSVLREESACYEHHFDPEMAALSLEIDLN